MNIIYLLLLLIIPFPLMAGTPYCSCYSVDTADPYNRPDDLNDYIRRTDPCVSCYSFDCYGINASGGLGSNELCQAACTAKKIKFVWTILDLNGGNDAYEYFVSMGNCSNEPLSPPPPPPDPPPVCDPAVTDCGGGGNGGEPPTMPCGYPGAQYLDCNVYDAKLEKTLDLDIHALGNTVGVESTRIVTSVNGVALAVGGVTTAVGKVDATLGKTNEALATLNKDTKDGLKKLQEAAVHKDVVLTMGSCIENLKNDEKLPKLSGAVLSDTLLSGFTCTGDTVYCSELKLQAQAYCRDVISQRLQSMYLNGGNVFVKCPTNYPAPVFDDAGQPQCKLPSGVPCLMPGQVNPVGKADPVCYSPVSIACPSAEFTPIIVLTGFSCDTKLNSAKFNMEMDKQQKIVDALSDPKLTKFVTENAKTAESAAAAVKTESDDYSKPFADPKHVDPTAFGVTNSGSTIEEFIGSTELRCINLYAITVCNPFDYAGDMVKRLIRPFISDYIFLVFNNSGSTCKMDFQLIDGQIAKVTKVPFSAMSEFEKDFCSNYVPVIRAFMSFFLTWFAALFLFREANDFAIILATGGASVDMSATRLAVQQNNALS